MDRGEAWRGVANLVVGNGGNHGVGGNSLRQILYRLDWIPRFHARTAHFELDAQKDGLR